MAAAALTRQMFHVQITWVDALGNESSPSEQLSFLTQDGSTVTVMPPTPPAMAAGWNVYVGTTTDELTRQNSARLELDTLWVMPETGLQEGVALPEGQVPTAFLRKVHLWRRG